MTNLLQLFLLSFLGSIIALVGGVIFLFNKRLSAELERYSIPFAAGVLVTVSILGLLPESMDILGEQALIVVLISFFCAYLFENFFFEIHHHGKGEHRHKNLKSSTTLVIFGDTIHNFIDGVTIATTFMIAPGLGLITALSTFLHEVPHEIGDFGVLLKAGWKKADVLLVNIISASFTIVGAFTAFFFIQNSSVIGVLLAISAGIFLYLGSVDFLPHADHGFESPKKSLIPLAIGIVAMIATFVLVPHAH